jgi:hypothetical protein
MTARVSDIPTLTLWLILCAIGARSAAAGDAPPWMHAQLSVALPAHDEKTSAIVLYSETTLSVGPDGRLKRLYREAVRILRPDGEVRGTVRV